MKKIRTRPFSELRAKMSPASRERVEKMAQQMLAEMPLSAIRHAQAMSQMHLAEILKINQASVSKLERRVDMNISTLRKFIESMGGKLEINAVFPGGTVQINQFDLAKAIESSFGAWKSADHPELSKGAGHFVRKIRKSYREKRRV